MAPHQALKEITSTMSRNVALEKTKHLDALIVGDSGFGIPHLDTYNYADPSVIWKIRDWINDLEAAPILWVNGPTAFGMPSGTASVALVVITCAINSRIPFLSHFCTKATRNFQIQTKEDTGFIGLVYSLIRQLLQFKTEEDAVNLSFEQLESLDGTMDS